MKDPLNLDDYCLIQMSQYKFRSIMNTLVKFPASIIIAALLNNQFGLTKSITNAIPELSITESITCAVVLASIVSIHVILCERQNE